MQAKEFSDRSLYRRRLGAAGLTAFSVTVGESDLHVMAGEDLSGPTREALGTVRAQIEAYVGARPGFREALEPWPEDAGAPESVRAMIAAGRSAGVGPMAAVAGTVAEFVGRRLLPLSPEVIVENGGDIFLASAQGRVAAVFAGESPLSMKLGLKLPPAPDGTGLCASSGTVGPSLSRGSADAAVVLSADVPLADAAATALGNRVKRREDLAGALEWVAAVPGVAGALVVIGEDLAAWGALELTEL
jgi:ApbE superfamily uncharacterized protein (UPF0280 family)